MPYDLFVSYSRRDNAFGRVSQLIDNIRGDFATFSNRELIPFFDEREIQGMEDWKNKILQGLRESRLLLACLSPSYVESEYCKWEFIEYLKHEFGHLHGFNGVVPVYFVEIPGWKDKGFDQRCAEWVSEIRKRQHFDMVPWYEQGESALQEAAVRERVEKLKIQIATAIERGERAGRCPGNIDAHNPHFVGRTANLRMLRATFVMPGNIGVLTAVDIERVPKNDNIDN